MAEPNAGARPGASSSPVYRRLATATVELVIERGYEATTVAALIERAGVSRADFDRHFADKENCVLTAVDEGVECFRRVVFSAYKAEALWRDGCAPLPTRRRAGFATIPATSASRRR